jgi:hypothetical protein
VKGLLLSVVFGNLPHTDGIHAGLRIFKGLCFLEVTVIPQGSIDVMYVRPLYGSENEVKVHSEVFTDFI